jgi:hypothetical protein
MGRLLGAADVYAAGMPAIDGSLAQKTFATRSKGMQAFADQHSKLATAAAAKSFGFKYH